MNRALFAGLSSTIAQQTRMDVAANNLANVSTVGYKGSRTTFQDAFYQTLRAGRSSTDSVGGTSPMQVGAGVGVGSIAMSQTQGALQRTGQPLDAGIDGNGMFIAKGVAGDCYTRDGAWTLDETNTLVMASTGYRIQGWMAADGAVTPSSTVDDLQFPLNAMRSPSATTSADTGGNLNSGAAVGDAISTSSTVYDSLGHAHDLSLTFTKTGVGAWSVSADVEGTTATGALTFGADGIVSGGGTLSVGPAVMPTGASDVTVTIDLSTLTQFATGAAPTVNYQNGFGAASLQSLTFTDGGVIQGNYSDGRSEVLGQVGMASFANPGGLDRVGNNLFINGTSSGTPQVGAASSGDRGQIIGRALEMSNTDLTESFLEMLITQRAYQASTRVITTANKLLEEAIRIVQ